METCKKIGISPLEDTENPNEDQEEIADTSKLNM